MSYLDFAKADALDKGAAPVKTEELAYLFGKYITIFFVNAGISYQTVLDAVAALTEMQTDFIDGKRPALDPVDKDIQNSDSLKLAMAVSATQFENSFDTRRALAAIKLSEFEFYQRIVVPFQYKRMIERIDYFPGTDKYVNE